VGESPIDPQKQSVAGFPNDVADFGNGNDSDFVDGDLRNFTQSFRFEDRLKPYISGRLRQRRGPSTCGGALQEWPRNFGQSYKTAGGTVV
jgi:hypothetical protein